MRAKGWGLTIDLLKWRLAYISKLTMTGTNCRGQRLNSLSSHAGRLPFWHRILSQKIVPGLDAHRAALSGL